MQDSDQEPAQQQPNPKPKRRFSKREGDPRPATKNRMPLGSRRKAVERRKQGSGYLPTRKIQNAPTARFWVVEARFDFVRSEAKNSLAWTYLI